MLLLDDIAVLACLFCVFCVFCARGQCCCSSVRLRGLFSSRVAVLRCLCSNAGRHDRLVEEGTRMSRSPVHRQLVMSVKRITAGACLPTSLPCSSSGLVSMARCGLR